MGRLPFLLLRSRPQKNCWDGVRRDAKEGGHITCSGRSTNLSESVAKCPPRKACVGRNQTSPGFLPRGCPGTPPQSVLRACGACPCWRPYRSWPLLAHTPMRFPNGIEIKVVAAGANKKVDDLVGHTESIRNGRGHRVDLCPDDFVTHNPTVCEETK